MTETAELTEVEAAPIELPAPAPPPVPWFERTLPLLGVFLGIAAFALLIAFLTVHARDPQELAVSPPAIRAHVVLSRWLDEGYFHYCGLTLRHPTNLEIYRSSTGGYTLSGFVIEKLYVMATGHYSFRLLALHNQVMVMITAALFGLLAFRLARRMDLEPRLALVAGMGVVFVVFTFPSNLAVYWEMSSQLMWLLFALVFLVAEERALESRTLALTIMQAAAAFLMTYMEYMCGIAFVVAWIAVQLILRRETGAWKRLVITAALPCLAALVLYDLQIRAAEARFPKAPITGSKFLFRSGLDGDAKYYGDHLDIARRRDVARGNWPKSAPYLFRWRWVLYLGSAAVLAFVAAFVKGRAPRITIEALAALIGTWILYAAVFSQAVMIHPYLYDVMLFAPLALALFALLPALAEALTGRSGAILLLALFCAIWYSLFQMRLYALWFPIVART